MIYLFDDNRHGQMSQNYILDFLQELPKYNFVVHFQKHSRNTDGYAFLKSATAVFVHDSFPNGDNYSDSGHKQTIIEKAKLLKIPYVIFSNQFAVTVFDDLHANSIKAIKKDRFYYNLIDFLNDYEQNKKLKIEKLAIGRDYEKAKTGIIDDRLSTFLFQKRKYFYYEDMIRVDSEAGKDLIELFYFKYGKEGEQKFLDFHNTCIEKKWGVKDLEKYVSNLVNQILEKYED